MQHIISHIIVAQKTKRYVHNQEARAARGRNGRCEELSSQNPEVPEAYVGDVEGWVL